MKKLAVLLLALAAFKANAAEKIPPKPEKYFNDFAGVVSASAGLRFNEQLAQFERETSNQVLVAVYKKMESDSEIADYTQRVAQSWGVGQRDKRNGAVLFVFTENRKIYIQVGYGLEGALPDITAFDITERHIKPQFKAGNYEAGLATGIDLICKAIRGEYKGSGKTVAESRARSDGGAAGALFLIIFLIVVLLIIRSRRRSGYGYSTWGGPFIGGWSSGGGGWSSGGSSGGGFSGFSGGGGSFGGGGAGSSW